MLTLFYAAGASSMAAHILLHESGLPFKAERVDLMTKQWSGGDYNLINPKSYVPAMRLDDGDILTEGNVILTHIADQVPEKGLLARPGERQRERQMEWLNFIAAEIHKNFITRERHGGVAANFLSKTEEGQADTRVFVSPRLAYVDQWLEGRRFLLGDNLSAPDAYLYVMTTWARRLGFDLSVWPNLQAFSTRVSQIDSVVRTAEVEGPPHSLRPALPHVAAAE
ncbi:MULTISPECIES: glutathione binding-like protein [Rhizobium/Agrobacterium group]|uniref:Glutathione S-transferase N-terminal domain-containing protein n=1 Tax=Agrobacterium vitis TaxID=373 RepID=A0AAE2UX02_AGRVI|nr:MULTISPECIES: glutathione binding-like protein [Rhizobium/Agrobacterium group]MBF2717260.1 glutathione S-transferase N-terminal domain-containing protein [Agrobacterium vitis]MCF1464026.1 glutathione S-transferase [Allorhizobium ampelinum]MCF1475401.1 glutathione S-transferase [Allorhizobium ampelinum]MVA54415.1 glutathione S-transferase [Agrobacterium vitis]MVA61061.1 glutathione S-transferase [Agrobacterium vitis]